MVTRTHISVTFIRTLSVLQLLYRCFSTSTHWHNTAQHNTTQHNTCSQPPPQTPHPCHFTKTDTSSQYQQFLPYHVFVQHAQLVLYFLSVAPLATHTQNWRLTTTMIMAYLEQKNWSVGLSLCMYVILNYQC